MGGSPSSVAHIISIVAGRSIAPNAVYIITRQGATGFDAEDAVDEQHNHIDQSQQELVPFSGH